jgi:hypothetical protein
MQIKNKYLKLKINNLHIKNDHNNHKTIHNSRKKGSDEFISFTTLGQYFEEEKSLPPFDKKTWESGVFPVNGQMIDQTIDEIN